jgi:hypothetical protein
VNAIDPSILTAEICTGNVWPLTIFFGLALIILMWVFRNPLPLSVKCLWAYVLIRALVAFEFPYPFWGPYTNTFKSTAGQAFAEVLLIPIGAAIFAPYIKKILPYLMLFTLGCVWFDWPGLMGALSFNTALTILAVPFLNFWLIIAALATMFTHHGSTAVLMTSTQLIPVLLKIKRRPVFLILGTTSLIVLAATAYFHSGALFDGSERLQVYAHFMRMWSKDWIAIVAGIGPGSFMWISLSESRFKAPLFLQMHSDFLQIIFELGVIGFGLALWVFVDAVRRAWERPRILSALFGFYAFTLTYHPLRFFPTAILSAYIFVKAFECDKKSAYIVQFKN